MPDPVPSLAQEMMKDQPDVAGTATPEPQAPIDDVGGNTETPQSPEGDQEPIAVFDDPPTPAAGAPEVPATPVAEDPETPEQGEQPPGGDGLTEGEAANLFALAEKMGVGWIKDKYDSEDAALHGLLHNAAKIGERDEDAAFGRQMRQHEAQFRDYLNRSQQPQPEVPQAPQQEEGPPSYDQRLLPYLEATDEGLLYAKPDAPPGLVTPEAIAQAQRYVDYQQQKRKEFESFDPEEVAAKAEQAAIQAIESRFYEQQLEQQTRSVLEKRFAEPWFFAKDSSGKTVVDPQTGLEVLSKYGHAYRQYAQELYNGPRKISDPVLLDEMAGNKVMAQYYADMMQQQQVPQQPAQPAQPAGMPPRQQVPQPPAAPPGGTRTRSVTGTSGPPVADTTQPMSLHEALLANNRIAAANGEKVYEER